MTTNSNRNIFAYYIIYMSHHPPGKRKQGRPKMTLRKTFEGDLKKMELTWGTAQREYKRDMFMEEKE